MRCPYCGHNESKVIDKRESGPNQEMTRRRRECLSCEKRFTTYESVEQIEITIVKKDGSRELFDRNKVLSGVVKACEKRAVSREQMEQLVDHVKNDLAAHGKTEVKSSEVGEYIMERLKTLDKVAYIRFASVYREFADLEQFENELQRLLRNR
ncbi:MAG: transcriptional regulator NrdR [Nanoarchaeota archaeon]